MALWWIEIGHIPTLQEAKDKLALIDQHGASSEVFNFKHLFDPSGNTITYDK